MFLFLEAYLFGKQETAESRNLLFFARTCQLIPQARKGGSSLFFFGHAFSCCRNVFLLFRAVSKSRCFVFRVFFFASKKKGKEYSIGKIFLSVFPTLFSKDVLVFLRKQINIQKPPDACRNIPRFQIRMLHNK